MKRSVRMLSLKPGDWVIAAAVLLLAAAIVIYYAVYVSDGDKYCVITHNNKVIHEIGLEEGQSLRIPVDSRYGCEIEIEGLRARFASSGCANQLCVHTGWIGTAQRASACLPNGVVVEIRSRNTGGLDAVAGTGGNLWHSKD